jgi:hypothetical protein
MSAWFGKGVLQRGHQSLTMVGCGDHDWMLPFSDGDPMCFILYAQFAGLIVCLVTLKHLKHTA